MVTNDWDKAFFFVFVISCPDRNPRNIHNFWYEETSSSLSQLQIWSYNILGLLSQHAAHLAAAEASMPADASIPLIAVLWPLDYTIGLYATRSLCPCMPGMKVESRAMMYVDAEMHRNMDYFKFIYGFVMFLGKKSVSPKAICCWIYIGGKQDWISLLTSFWVAFSVHFCN